MTHRNKMIAAFNLASVLGIASLGQAHAEDELYDYVGGRIFWSSVGATGQVDTTGAAIAKTSKTMITMSDLGTLIVRYNVPPSVYLATGTGAVQLTANLMDPGFGASVDVSLIEVPIDAPPAPGAKTASAPARTVLRLTSSDADDGIGVLTTRCVAQPSVTTFAGFSFANNVYYIQAVLTWDTKDQRAPALRALKIGFSGTQFNPADGSCTAPPPK